VYCEDKVHWQFVGCTIVYQHPVALVNHLIRRSSVGDATSCVSLIGDVLRTLLCSELYYNCFIFSIHILCW
jgi:hypothetical protein